MPEDDDILSRLGHALQSMWGNDTKPAPAQAPVQVAPVNPSGEGPRIPSWSYWNPGEGASIKQVAQAGQDLADEVEEARQRNLRTAEFAQKMGAPVTRNPVRFERDAPSQQSAAVAYLQGKK